MIYTKYDLSLINYLQFLIVWIYKLYLKRMANQKFFVINFFKQIFTWWNSQTVGTFLYTFFKGKFVGKDEFGNKYYSSSSGKRWVIYNGLVESSKIPPEWHLWIHFLNKEKPNNRFEKFKWQKTHKENATGTKEAYKPEGSLSSGSKTEHKKYETWK